MLTLEKIRKQTVTDTIIEQVAERIRAGELRPGDPVPNELQLAEQLGVSRNSVREALKAMQVVGILERSHDGTVVGPRALVAVLHQDLRADLAAKRLDIVHLYEARRYVEGDIAALAAARRTDGDLAELRRQVQAMEASAEVDDFDAYFALDMQFHATVCRVAGNVVFTQIWTLIHELILGARGDWEPLPGLVELSNENHRALVEALAAADPERARATVHETLLRVETLILEGLEAGGGRSSNGRSP